MPTDTNVQNLIINKLTQAQYEGVANPSDTELYLVPDNSVSRNIGEIVSSSLPLTDAGLHLLDGTRLSGDGIYKEFVQYIADLYTENPYANYFMQPVSPIETAWTQPVITGNGTLGGDSFAVDGRNYSSDAMYKAFDGDSSSYWETYNYALMDTCYISNPVPIKISNIVASSSSNRGWTSITISGSNDNVTYSEEQTISTVNASNTDTFACNFSGYYKYYKITYTNRYTSSSGYYARITNIAITATYLEPSLTAEQNWQNTVAQYGVCGKFVYDSTLNTVRLPKITGFLEGTTDVRALGDLVEAGLPNITGSFSDYATAKYITSATGAFEQTITKSTSSGNWQSASSGNGAIGFDASLSNSIYGNSNTVQPQTIKTLYYIVVATAPKTDIVVDIDEIATDLNGKCDVDGTNATFPHITETYVNGTSWYRVYSDGWCEQGGYFNPSSTSNTITFLLPFADTTYYFEHLTYKSGPATSGGYHYWSSATTNNITLVDSASTLSDGTRWYACGYIN